jgi:hypothetical protein
MRFLKFLGKTLLELAILAVLLVILTNIIADRLSKQLDNVDLTYEETLPRR